MMIGSSLPIVSAVLDGFSVQQTYAGQFADVPTILIEMDFMSNPDEDALMETDEYQQKLAHGMCNGIVHYFSAI